MLNLNNNETDDWVEDPETRSSVFCHGCGWNPKKGQKIAIMARLTDKENSKKMIQLLCLSCSTTFFDYFKPYGEEYPNISLVRIKLIQKVRRKKK